MLDKSPLHLAAVVGRTSTVQYLLQNGAAKLIDSTNNEGRTPLHLAAAGGYASTVRYLLQNGAAKSVDSTDNDGRTPLHLAATARATSTIQYLLQNGAAKSVDLTDIDSKTLIYLAAAAGYTSINRYLLHNEITKSVNSTDKDSKTQLYLDVMARYTSIVESLLERGIVDKNGKTPLHLAAASGDTPTIQYLLQNGTLEFVNSTDKDGKTPLHLAAAGGYTSTVRYLLKNGAANSVNAVDKNGKTPLHWAAATGDTPTIQYLLQNGTSEFINSTDKDGKTPLHLAAAGGYTSTVRYLLENGAANSVNAVDKDGKTPFHLAAAKSASTAQLLLENNVSGLKDSSGRTSPTRAPGNQPGASLRDEEPVALSGGTDQHITQKKTAVELPIIIETSYVTACPDTGSDGNAMIEAKAQSLGLRIHEDTAGTSFMLANGRRITSKGSASARCSFAKGGQQVFTIVFNIFANLATPVVIGKDFLETTETLTKHHDRLKLSTQLSVPSSPRILHLNPPRKLLRCFLNAEEVYANADTGAEMNLASLKFASRRGFRIERPDPKHREVVLADGSRATVVGQFGARFDTFEKPSKNTIRPRSQWKTFYILDGLTTDVLLGEDILYEIAAFVEQANSFVDLKRVHPDFDLNLVVWLTGLAKFLKRRTAVSPADPEEAFQKDIDEDDAREQDRRQTAAREIARRSLPERAAKEAIEKDKQQEHNKRRDQRIKEHKANMAAAGLGKATFSASQCDH
ncbi:hypothetical protein DL765_008490 [Monosporascus sp. GIB2]|nr:hypothetical protein DL765_008490 [Monosporascus sp. GIB2]